MFKTVTFLLLVGLCQGFNFFELSPYDPKYDDKEVAVKSEAVSALAAPLPGQGKCNLHQLEFCQKVFAKDVGGNATIIFKQPREFGKLLKKMYDAPLTEGLLLACSSRDDFHKCLGHDYHPCTDVFDIIKQQKLEKVRDAFLLADIYNDLEFDCNAGLAQSTRHWDCIKKVHNDVQYEQHAEECFAQYNATVTKDPSKYCEAAEGFSFCVTQVYQGFSECFNKEILWWECERLLRRSQLDGFCRTTSCHKVFELQDFKLTKGLSYQEQQKTSFLKPAQKQLFRELAEKFRQADKRQ